MEFITDWIAQIIIFILLATIIDLLIPNIGMKKYIKLVIGLILILILLAPIFALFQLDIESALKHTYSTVFEQEGSLEKVNDAIEMQKSEIEMTHDAYILEEMVVQLKSLANESLNEHHQAEISNIEFVFNDDTAMSYEGLEEVIVYLQESTAEEGGIRTVEEVVIGASDKEKIKDDDEIINQLRESWELTDKKITVYWEGGAS
ncbi:stage III sporulation protein AF [Oceanobacillus sp. FSL H7-0719]|uniref:stage III sporulation protein AF n=1 Tax=Oceanobacillus sp. FSL H7-0719 TaxID=2954507 RepID=UPI003253C983